MCTLWPGSSNFSNILRPVEAPFIQSCDIKEVQNPKYRHSLGVVAHDKKTSQLLLSPHKGLQVISIPGDT
jgi:hypothetical protein